MTYWRNILDVVREDQLQQMHADISPVPTFVHSDFSPPSAEGLEVIELTVLDISV